jgi:hypothetical protein
MSGRGMACYGEMSPYHNISTSKKNSTMIASENGFGEKPDTALDGADGHA